MSDQDLREIEKNHRNPVKDPRPSKSKKLRLTKEKKGEIDKRQLGSSKANFSKARDALRSYINKGKSLSQTAQDDEDSEEYEIEVLPAKKQVKYESESSSEESSEEFPKKKPKKSKRVKKVKDTKEVDDLKAELKKLKELPKPVPIPQEEIKLHPTAPETERISPQQEQKPQVYQQRQLPGNILTNQQITDAIRRRMLGSF